MHNLHVSALKYSLPNLHRQSSKIALNFTMMHEFCSIFIRNTAKQGRSLTHMVSPDKIQHDHPLPLPSSVFLAADQSLGSVCPGFAKTRSRSELASADQCLKFCEVTPSAETLSTLNNPRDLDLDCSAAFSGSVKAGTLECR